MQKTFYYKYENKDYPVVVTYKKMKNIRYRYRDGTFLVSCPRLVPRFQIEMGLKKFAPSLIKKCDKEKALTDEYVYIFGVKIPLPQDHIINFTNGESIKYKDKEDLEKKLKKLLLNVITARVRYYEGIMGINPPYKVRVRKMTSRFGSNSSYSHGLTFNSCMVHYSYKIIDGLVVHELSHHFERNHSKNFYAIVYKYYPDYPIYDRKLKKGIFQ